jgi:cytochrome c5
MSVGTSMWLGILFLVLAVTAVLLQAWLWGPKFWNEEHKKTTAPKAWLRFHAAVGYTYGLIYVGMMWNMFPRLWEYQYELPARTVFHAVIAIVLGVLLISKIFILVFFRHFEEAVPRFGFAIMLCTVVLISLSVPHAARALDLQGRIADPDNIARVEQVLGEIELGEGAPDLAELTSHEGLQKGRDLLVNKCVSCHDMRTILLVPRTGARWHELVVRMQDKPDPFSSEPLTDDEVPYVTAYLVAITPDIQASRKRKVEEERTREAVEQKTVAAMAVPSAADAVGTSVAVHQVDETKGKAILDGRCMDCHELDEIESFGGADVAGWSKVITDMVEEGAEITEEEARLLAPYLASIYAKK